MIESSGVQIELHSAHSEANNNLDYEDNSDVLSKHEDQNNHIRIEVNNEDQSSHMEYSLQSSEF